MRTRRTSERCFLGEATVANFAEAPKPLHHLGKESFAARLLSYGGPDNAGEGAWSATGRLAAVGQKKIKTQL